MKPNRSPKPSEDRFPPIPTFHDQPFRWLVRHWYWCKRVKARGTLACPACGVRGTWKPYGLFSWQDRLVRRWLCKWCGFYDGTDGRFWAVMDSRSGVWALPYEVTPRMLRTGLATTPQRLAQGSTAYPKAYSPFAG